jgi:hypothetical protein
MFMRAIILATVALLLPAVWAAVAEDEKPNILEGKVKEVKSGDLKLVMTDKDGKNEHSHFVAKDAKIIIGGKAGTLGDLKPGQVIKVRTKKTDDKVQVVEIQG